MVTALQIALLLILIALIGIILGYLFGRLACKKRENSLYFEKSEYCEDQYNTSLMHNESSESANRDYNRDITATEPKENMNELLNYNNSEAAAASDSNIHSLIDESAKEHNKQTQKSQESTKEAVAEEQTITALERENLESTAHNSLGEEKSEIEKSGSSENVSSQENAASVAAMSKEAEATDADGKAQSNESLQLPDDRYKPAVLTEPKNGKKDNLTRIKGIGRIIEGKLNDLGVFHFEQIAAWSEDEVKWVDSHLAFSGRIIREDWIGQAKILANGEETEFSKRVDKGEVATSKAE